MAYGWLVISLFLIIAGCLYAYYVGVINFMVNGPDGDQSSGINHDMKEGKQSTQSVNAINFNVQMAKNIPIFIIVGAFVFAVARAIAVKPGG